MPEGKTPSHGRTMREVLDKGFRKEKREGIYREENSFSVKGEGEVCSQKRRTSSV